MQLKTHIERSGLNVGAYADEVGVSHQTIYSALKGVYTPQTAQKIYDYSSGKVELVIRPNKKESD